MDRIFQKRIDYKRQQDHWPRPIHIVLSATICKAWESIYFNWIVLHYEIVTQGISYTVCYH